MRLYVAFIIFTLIVGWLFIKYITLPKNQSVTTYTTNLQPTTSPSPLDTPTVPSDKNVAPPVPGANTTAAERDNFIKKLISLEKSGDTLDISNCNSPNPQVLIVKVNTKVTLINNSAEDRQIDLNKTHNYIVPAKKTASMTADLDPTLAFFPYRCNAVQTAGYIHVAR